jgi:hypothetical protein
MTYQRVAEFCNSEADNARSVWVDSISGSDRGMGDGLAAGAARVVGALVAAGGDAGGIDAGRRGTSTESESTGIDALWGRGCSREAARGASCDVFGRSTGATGAALEGDAAGAIGAAGRRAAADATGAAGGRAAAGVTGAAGRRATAGATGAASRRATAGAVGSALEGAAAAVAARTAIGDA